MTTETRARDSHSGSRFGDVIARLLGWLPGMLGDPLVFDRWRWLARAGRSGVRTLDAGCGSGWFAIYMAGNGNEVVGINFDEKAVAAAERRVKARGIDHARFIAGDLRALDRMAPELGTFDQIICFETIEHIKDDFKLVRDLASMLNPGGRLMLTTPSSERPPLIGEKWSDVEDGSHVRFGYTHAELAERCTAAGLQIVEQGRLGGVVVQWLYNAALRMVPKFGAHVAILLSLALRPLQVLDRPLTRLRRGPMLCISMMAERPAGPPAPPPARAEAVAEPEPARAADPTLGLAGASAEGAAELDRIFRRVCPLEVEQARWLVDRPVEAMVSVATAAEVVDPEPILETEVRRGDEDTDGERPNARRAVGLILRTSLALQLLGMISGVELARGLGVHNRGALAASMLWGTLAGNLGTLGIEESTTYHVAKDPDQTGTITGSALALSAIQSALFGALIVGLIPIVLHAHSQYVIIAAWIYTLYVPFNMVSVTLNSVLNGLHRYASFNAVLMAVGLFVLGAQTLLLVLGVMTVHTLVIAFVSMYLCTACYTARLVFLKAKVRHLHVSRRMMRSLFAYGIRSHASTVPATLNFSLDQLVISIFLTTTQLGIYVIAVTMSTFTALVGGAFAKAILPNVASQAEGPERALLSRRLVSATLVISTCVTVPVLLLAPWLMRIFFGHGYAVGAGVARILLVAAIALSTNRALEAVLRGVGRPLDAGIAEFIALGATCLGLAVLIPLLGLDGAGLTSLFAYLVSMAFMTLRATKALEISGPQLLTPDREAVIAIRGRFARA